MTLHPLHHLVLQPVPTNHSSPSSVRLQDVSFGEARRVRSIYQTNYSKGGNHSHPTNVSKIFYKPMVMNTANNTNNNQNNEQKNDDNTEKEEEKKKKKMGIRYAEKRRTSTCQFADRVARISIDHYKDIVPKKYQLPQTCLATIVAHNSQTGELQVLSMGVGTKFLSESVLNEEAATTYGQRIRDCHAEVLARRGFCRFLCLEILDLLLLLKSSTATNSTDNHDHDHDHHDNENDYNDKDNGKRNFINNRGHILERTTTTTNNNNNNNKGNNNKNKLQFKLQSTISLHLYTSSAPCGNAVLKKFSKMKKEIYRDDLGPSEWPMMTKQQEQQHEKHEPILGHSIHLGQFMLLVKKDNTINVDVDVSAAAAAAASDDDRQKRHDNPSKMTTIASPSASKTATAITTATATAPSVASVSEINPKKKTKKRKKVWLAHESDDWTPPGTTTVTTNKGSIHTCSDKICRWNYLGLQGSLLAAFMENPLYMSTMTVGRKLTECICRRAVCCRLGENFDHQQFASSLKTTSTTTSKTKTASPPPPPPTTTTNCVTNDIDTCSLLGGARNYRINHPAILGTAVYMDEFGAVETNSDIVGQDVRFHSTLSWAWWRASNSGHHNNSHNDDNNNQLECIDGRTGYLTNLDLDSSDDALEGNDETISGPPTPSLLCTWNLTRLFMEARSIIDDEQGQNDDNPEYYSSLSSLRGLKRQVSPYHEKTKDILLTKHKVLRDWNRRSEKSG